MSKVFELLEEEWVRLRGNRVAANRLADVCRSAGGGATLADVERYVRAAHPADADRVLLALVSRAVSPEQASNADLAARVLLQLLLPGTRNLAKRWWALGDSDERAAAAVAAVYNRIRTYPLERRPGRVAANVLMDAGQDLRRSVPRVVATPCGEPTLEAVGGRSTPRSAYRNPAEELSEVLADAVADGVITLDDAELIARSRIGGDRVADIARGRGLTARTLWDRRQRAELTLARTG